MSPACRACKQGKRRCDKAVPKCSLCERTGRECDYSDRLRPSPTAEDFALMKARLDDFEKRIAVPSSVITSTFLASTPAINEAIEVCTTGGVTSTLASNSRAKATNFPAALFLDIDCFVMARMQLPAPAPTCIPMVRRTGYNVRSNLSPDKY